MNREEFDTEFLPFHAACYPESVDWLAKLEKRGLRDQTLDQWFKELWKCDLDDAKQAVEELWRNGEQPRGFGRHPVIIAAACRRLRVKMIPDRYVDGEQVFKCLQCQDSGLVIIWSFRSMQAIVRGLFPGEGKTASGTETRNVNCYTSAVACTCEAGERFRRYTVRFDPSIMLEAPLFLNDAVEQEKLRTFVEMMKQGW